ncbi:MAG TPA: glycosyltransferase family 2 protein [Acidimicrobiales bacterium]|nr:glycosyltransferase family 2 protein [Acidimicrobiales bacterium]
MPANGPLVSVVLPTRNRPGRLPRALSSVLAQTYKRLELLVVDDASSTPAEEVVDQVGRGDRRVQLLRFEKQMGASAARNAAFKRAAGDVIAFIDDDDQWKPQKLERQVSYLAAHPRTGIVTADFEVMDERRAEILIHRGPASFRRHHLWWFNLPGSFVCGIARREAVDGELWLDESFLSAEDWDMWVRCARRTSIGVVKEVLGRQTLHADGQLTDPSSRLQGLKAFEGRHAPSLSKASLAFLRAHQQMEMGTGIRKRLNVLRSLATDSPRASTLLLVEQSARQIGKVRRDPGLVDRALVRAIGSE